MGKLTRQTPPENLIRYVSTAEHYDVVQKLGAIEHQSEQLITQACDRICRFRVANDTNKSCITCAAAACPIIQLAELIGI